MSVAYVDTSCLIAVAFGEPGADVLAQRLDEYSVLASSNLLEAEFKSALMREGVEGDGGVTGNITWVLPDRRLTSELESVLVAGYLRGADLWHVATALYLAESPGDVDFISLDAAQVDVAARLGFLTPQ